MRYRITFERDEHGAPKQAPVEIAAGKLCVSKNKFHLHAKVDAAPTVDAFFAIPMFEIRDDHGRTVWLDGKVIDNEAVEGSCNCN